MAKQRSNMDYIKTNSMYDRRKFSLALFVAVFSVFGSVATAQRIDVEPKSIAAKEGEKISLLCRAPQPIEGYCRITIPGERPIILLNDSISRPGFEYFGSGFHNGQCGITINAVKPENHGKMICQVQINNEESSGEIDISINLAPLPQEIQMKNPPEFEVNTDIEADCISKDGRPAGTISWYLDDQQLPLRDEPEISENYDSQRNQTLFTVRQRLTRIATADDNGRRLTCRVSHPSLNGGYADISTQLIITFRPQALPEEVVRDLEIGRQAGVSIVIRANPRPQVQWRIAGVVVKQGDQTERYIATDPMDLGNGQYNVTLIITSLTLEDLSRSYILRANNALGTQEYTIRLGSASAVEGSGLGILGTIAISIVCIFILIVVVLTLVAKITKRWCFAGDSLHPNGPDSEAQIAPSEDEGGKTHEHFEQHEKATMGDEEENGLQQQQNHENGVKNSNSNGNTKGNTSV